jgi:sec-independent protein translocase protein TatA
MESPVIATLFSGGHIIVIIAVLLLFFGGSKIPEFMGGLGKGMKEFKKAMKEDEDPKDLTKDDPKKEIKE